MKSVETVSTNLFKEWKKELGLYSNPTLKANSERQLKETQARYQQMMDAMRTARKKSGPGSGGAEGPHALPETQSECAGRRSLKGRSWIDSAPGSPSRMPKGLLPPWIVEPRMTRGGFPPLVGSWLRAMIRGWNPAWHLLNSQGFSAPGWIKLHKSRLMLTLQIVTV
jgi:hypothetical protein